MSSAARFDSVVTNPGGTGSSVVPTLSSHQAGDELEIFVANTGNVAWAAPAGWTRRDQGIIGTASNGLVGTLLYRRVLSTDTLPLSSPTCNLGATVTRFAVCRTIRNADVEGVFTLPEWGSFGRATGTANPIRPPTIITPAPEMLATIYYCQRAATNAPEQSGYTQDREVISSGTLVLNVSEQVISSQQTTLTNQDASPTSGARWVAMIVCTPSPDYVYYRSGTQAFSASATSVTPTLPAGTSASDNRGNKDLIILTAQCAGATPTLDSPGDWTEIPTFSTTTDGGGTTTRKWWTLYDGSLASQVNRTPSGEILAYLSTYRNPDQTTPIGNHGAQSNASSTSGTWPEMVRTATKSTVQITCIANATPTFIAPAGWTERNDSQGVSCADQVFDAATTINSGSLTLSAASPNVGGIVEIRSVSSVGSPSVSPSLSPSSSASPSVSPSASVSPSISPSLSPSASTSPSSSASPSAGPIIFGTAAWGHVTGVLEDHVRTFASNWTGTGTVGSTGDAEVMCMGAGQFMESEVVETGTVSVELSQNVYAAGDTVLLRYRHGATVAACEAAAWTNYTNPFISLGFIQLRVESTL